MVMERVVIAAVFLLLFSCQPSEAGRVVVRRPPPTLARRQRHYTSPRAGGDGGGGVSVPPAVQYETRWYTQRLDHFNSAPASYATFQQRYLVNDTFWGGPTAPIFLYAGNEGDVDLFTNNTGFMWESAPRFRALLVFVEHRYYGESMPFGGTRAAAFRDARTKGYLTVTQALADYASFVLSLKANLSAPAAPVVVFGGSYGGSKSSAVEHVLLVQLYDYKGNMTSSRLCAPLMMLHARCFRLQCWLPGSGSSTPTSPLVP